MMFLAYVPEEEVVYKRQKKLNFLSAKEWNSTQSEFFKDNNLKCPICREFTLYRAPGLWFDSCNKCYNCFSHEEVLDAN